MKISIFRLGLIAMSSLGFFNNTIAQEAEKVKYDAHVLFHPLFNFQPGNEYRSGSGAPGPKYWQNRADYKINVALEEEKGAVSGEVELTYKNNSPENLEFISTRTHSAAIREAPKPHRLPAGVSVTWVLTVVIPSKR